MIKLTRHATSLTQLTYRNRVNNLNVYPSCKTRVERADIEESKSDVAMNAWPPHASYPSGNFF